MSDSGIFIMAKTKTKSTAGAKVKPKVKPKAKRVNPLRQRRSNMLCIIKNLVPKSPKPVYG